MTGLSYETLEHSRTVAMLVGHVCYLKSKGSGWVLMDVPPSTPYYTIYPNGDAVENKGCQ